jgi:hypothetical protein
LAANPNHNDERGLLIEVRAPIVTRREALAVTRDALRDLMSRIAAIASDPMLTEVFLTWYARLEAASRLCPDFELSDVASQALDELVHGVHAAEADLEVLADWLDLLPRNALALVEITPVVFAAWKPVHHDDEQSLGNPPAEEKWTSTPRTRASMSSAA